MGTLLNVSYNNAQGESGIQCKTEAEFLDVIGTNVVKVIPPCYTQSPLLCKVCNV